MSSRPLAQALALFSVIGLATLVANGTKHDLASALTLHASFDSAQQNAFLGRWKLTSTATPPVYVGWLEVSIENEQLTARFSNRGGTPTPVASVQITNGELVFQPAAGRRGPSPEHRARVQGDRLTGSTTSGDQTIAFVGERPPTWPAADASATHQFGPPVELFDGKSMDAFDLVRPDQPWFVINGEMTNSPAGVKPAPGSNLRSKQKFLGCPSAGGFSINSLRSVVCHVASIGRPCRIHPS